jgi:hypothetical protein
MTGDIFIEHLLSALSTAVESDRRHPGCSTKPAILFCDNCACYYNEEILKELALHGILLVTYPPHTSHIF